MNSNGQLRSLDRRISSSIEKHLVEPGHMVDVKSAYVVLYKIFEGSPLVFIGASIIRKLGPPYMFKNSLFLPLTFPVSTDLLSSVVFTLFACVLLLSLLPFVF